MRPLIRCFASAPTALALAAVVTLLAFPKSADAQDQAYDLYLERCSGGCTLTPGASNAREYRTDLINTDGAATLSEFSRGDAVWDNVVECVRQVYAPFNVNVTDVLPPPSSKFHMAIVAGTAAEAGLPAGIGGLGNVECNTPLNNRISLTFDIWGSDVNRICATIAQESAHNFGLGHAFHCSDPMTYLNLCGRAFFRDESFECGEFAAGDPTCRCSGPSQNSHRYLMGKLGPNPNPLPGPELTITSLTADQTVQDGFGVAVNAITNRGISKVEFRFNGSLLHTEPGPELGTPQNAYSFNAPMDLADGYIDIEITAFDDIGTTSVATVTVLKGAPCSDASMCNEGQTCDDGRCNSPIATGELGDQCTAPTDCISGICPVEAGGSGFCSQECDPASVLNECGNGLECLASGFCWPENTGGGCGCSSSSDAGGPLGGLLLLLGLAFATRRRRRNK